MANIMSRNHNAKYAQYFSQAFAIPNNNTVSASIKFLSTSSASSTTARNFESISSNVVRGDADREKVLERYKPI